MRLVFELVVLFNVLVLIFLRRDNRWLRRIFLVLLPSLHLANVSLLLRLFQVAYRAAYTFEAESFQSLRRLFLMLFAEDVGLPGAAILNVVFHLVPRLYHPVFDCAAHVEARAAVLEIALQAAALARLSVLLAV